MQNACILVTLFLMGLMPLCWAAGATAVDSLIRLDDSVSSPSFQLSAPAYIQSPPVQSSQTSFSQADTQAIETLWLSTLQQRPVIQYALQQLSLSPQLRKAASSSLAHRTLEGLIGGAGYIPLSVGGNLGVSSAAQGEIGRAHV